MKQKFPHPIPYQGSKRSLARDIMANAGGPCNTLYEPFAGSAAISIYCSYNNLANRFVIGDSLTELVELWKLIINTPEETAKEYKYIWEGFKDGDYEYFFKVRERFNKERNPIDLLYLIVRCVKNAVRFNRNGNFTQSADKRRKGTKPETIRASILAASFLLKGKTEFYAGDFSECIEGATSEDLVYLDPPYQGTSYGLDKRYYQQITRENLCAVLTKLNTSDIPFLLSYDGYSGEKSYGEPLPDSLEMKKIHLNAGRSSQATLSGKKAITIESLYVSNKIVCDSKSNSELLAQLDNKKEILIAHL